MDRHIICTTKISLKIKFVQTYCPLLRCKRNRAFPSGGTCRELWEKYQVSACWFKILTHNLWRFHLFDMSKYLCSSFCLGKCALMRYSIQVEMHDCSYVTCRRQWFLIYKAQPSLIAWAFLKRPVNIFGFALQEHLYILNFKISVWLAKVLCGLSCGHLQESNPQIKQQRALDLAKMWVYFHKYPG